MPDTLSPGEIDLRLRSFFQPKTGDDQFVGIGLLSCGGCDTPLRACRDRIHRYAGARAVYLCSAEGGCGRVEVDTCDIDRHLREFTVDRLSDVRFAAECANLRLARIEQDMAEYREFDLSERKNRKGMRKFLIRTGRFRSRAQAELAIDTLIAGRDLRLAELASERARLVAGTQRAATAVPPRLVLARWNDAGILERRAMLATALGPDRLLVDPDATDRASGALLRIAAAR